jgi:hypothetical protein
VLRAYLYQAAYIKLSDEGIHISDFKTLFWPVQADCGWSEIQEVDVTQPGLQSLFDVGTILIETAGAKPNLKLSYLGQVDQLRDFIESKRVATPVLTHNV